MDEGAVLLRMGYYELAVPDRETAVELVRLLMRCRQTTVSANGLAVAAEEPWPHVWLQPLKGLQEKAGG